MAEEVVINVRQQSQGNALSEAEQRMLALKARIEEINRLQADYARKGITGTGDLTQERTALQRELGGLERDQAQVARERREADRGATKERVDAERAITREQREQEAVANARMRAAGALATAGLAFGGVMADDYFQRRGIGLRDAAAGRDYDRRRGLRGERGYSVQEAAGDLHAMEDELFRHQNQRPELQNSRWSKALLGGIAGIAGGATTGGVVGSVVPGFGTAIGAAVGGGIGFGAGALGGWLYGDRQVKEGDTASARLSRDIEQQKKDRAAYVGNQLGPELEGRKAILDYDMKSYRVALDKISAEKEYQRLLPLIGAEKAAEAAQDKVALEQRERAGQWAGIINARSGSRDSVRAATFATSAGTYDQGAGAAEWLRRIHDKMGEPAIKEWEAR